MSWGLPLRLAATGWRTGGRGLSLVACGWALSVCAILLGGQVIAAMSHEQSVCEARNPVMAEPGTTHGPVANVVEDRLGDRPMTRVVVSSAASRLTPPPGIAQLPKTGEALVSPALARLAAGNPHARAAIGGRIAGVIGQAGVTTRDELYAYVGATSVTGNSFYLAAFGGGDSQCAAYAPGAFEWGAFLALILGPALLAGWSFTSAGASRREARYRALHLLGAPAKACARAGALELASAAAVGAAAGVGAFTFLNGRVAGSGLLGVSWYPVARLHMAVIVAVVGLALALAAYAGARLGRRGASDARSVAPAKRGRSWAAVASGAAALIGAGFLLWLWVTIPPPGHQYPDASLGFYYAGVLLAIAGGLTAFIPVVRRLAAHPPGGDGPLTWRLAIARIGWYPARSLALVLATVVTIMAVGLGTSLTQVSAQLGLGDDSDAEISSSFDPATLTNAQLSTLLGRNGFITITASRSSRPDDESGTPPLALISVGTCQALVRAQARSSDMCAAAASGRATRLAATELVADPTSTLVAGETLDVDLRQGSQRITVPAQILASEDVAAYATLLLPAADAAWITKVPDVTAEFRARPGAEYDAVQARIRSLTPSAITYTHVADESALRRAERLRAAITGLSILTLVLMASLFIAAAAQARSSQARSRATLTGLGVPGRLLTGSLAVEAALPIALAASFFVPVTIATGQVFEAWYFPGRPVSTTIATSTLAATAAVFLAAILAAIAGSAGRFRPDELRRPD